MRKVIIFYAVLFVVTAIVSSCTGARQENTQQNGESGTYRCPMKCEGEKTYRQQGQCPVCNMDLEKVEDH